MFSNIFFPENSAVYEITWKNIVELQMTTWLMRIACRIPEATKAHSKFVILIAFPLQQWMHEDASVLRYTYIDMIWYICQLQLGKHPMAVVQYSFTHKQYIE
jgi:hypothetical protein